MLEMKLTKGILALGLFVVLTTYNFAYANTTINGDLIAPPVKEEPKTPDNGSRKTSSIESNPPAASINMAKAASRKSSPPAVNGCACSCATTNGRVPATSRATARTDAYWNCVKGCLRSWGVSAVQIALCAGVCAFGGIPLCALCIGVDVSVLMLCMIGCDVYSGNPGTGGDGHVPVIVRRTQRGSGRSAVSRVLAFQGQR